MDKEWLQSLPIIFDAVKSEANRRDASRGFGFELARSFEFSSAIIEVDDRRDYGEIRLVAIGVIDRRLHVLTFTIRADKLRVISLRKANDREIRRHKRLFDSETG